MLTLIIIGAVAGLTMWITGIGGGAIIAFSLALFAHFPQKLTQGTTLFIVAAPISLLAAYRYHQEGFVDLKSGLIVMVAFTIFSFLGAMISLELPNHLLKNFMGVVLIGMGLKVLFF